MFITLLRCSGEAITHTKIIHKYIKIHYIYLELNIQTYTANNKDVFRRRSNMLTKIRLQTPVHGSRCQHTF
jgi:hypothetical protein